MSLSCEICLERYGDNDKDIKAPRILECGHTFCSGCIRKNTQKNNGKIICAVCRYVDKRAFDKIPFNRILYDLVRKEKEGKKGFDYGSICSTGGEELTDQSLDFNIGFIGDQFVGKTSISQCYQSGKSLKDSFNETTIGLGIFSKTIIKNDWKINIKIWDTMGQERYDSLNLGFIRGLHGCFIVFDVTDKSSFDSLEKWIQFYKGFNQYKKCIIVILGNKIDLGQNRVVSKESAEKFSASVGAPYFETSSVNMAGLEDAFNLMIDEIFASMKSVEDVKIVKGSKVLRRKKKEEENNVSDCNCLN